MPRPLSWIEENFGRFQWSDDPKRRGRIVIAGDWVLHNIARVKPPIPLLSGAGRPLSVIACHALIADRLLAVLDDLKDRHLHHLINTFDGCWVARHMSWDPSRSLSRHSWGIAVDVNARQFPYGSTHKQDPRLIAAFRRHGFEWGGDWRTPDPMHFEIISLEALTEDQLGVKIVVNDELVSGAGRLVDGHAEGPLEPVVAALGATLTPHPEQGKIYIYGARKE